MAINISDLIKDSHERALRKGWYSPPQTRTERLLNIHGEVSEAMESERNGEPLLWTDAAGKPQGLASELADIIIRIADWCGWEEIPLEEAIRQKSEYNETREVRHGGKKF